MRVFTDRRLICRRFTLVEIIVVMAILAVLMGMGVGVYSLAMDKAKRSKTEALIKKLEVTLEAFKAKYGYYPQTENITTPINYHFHPDLYAMEGGLINTAWSTAESQNYFWKTIDYEYLLNSATEQYNNRPILVDAWGHPIYYRCPGIVNTSSFDIASTGPNGKAGLDTNDLYIRAGSTKNKLNSSATSPPVFDTKTNDDIGNF